MIAIEKERVLLESIEYLSNAIAQIEFHFGLTWGQDFRKSSISRHVIGTSRLPFLLLVACITLLGCFVHPVPITPSLKKGIFNRVAVRLRKVHIRRQEGERRGQSHSDFFCIFGQSIYRIKNYLANNLCPYCLSYQNESKRLDVIKIKLEFIFLIYRRGLSFNESVVTKLNLLYLLQIHYISVYSSKILQRLF